MPQFKVFYNGAKCGASAPDHLHFQAVASCYFRMLTYFDADLEPELAHLDSAAYPYRHYKFTSYSIEELEQQMANIKAELMELPENQGEPEPLVNVFMEAGSARNNIPTLEHPAVDVLVIPRRAHRPSCYGTGQDQMMISPGAIDVFGGIVTCRREDFDNIDDETLEQILRETTFFYE
jgi:hypothetical protein